MLLPKFFTVCLLPTLVFTKPITTRSDCVNSPTSRQCWGDGFDIDTDYDTEWPTTGNVVEYNLEVTNTTLAPDGFSRLVMAVNGQYPGPTITANWGDILKITVKNSLQNNGTSMHWHGIRQLNSSTDDGANGVTECPIAPGQSKTYTFQCTQYGSSWYHSHFSAQYGDGVVGPIIINGPSTANYDIDLGALPITDWYHNTVYNNAILAATSGPPTAQNGLINGTMLSADGLSGAYNKVILSQNTTYRLRIVNTAVDNHFKVHLDGHNFTVIAADFVPIVSYTTDWLFVAIGQRYDVIITADQAIDNYWFRAEVQTGCGTNANNGNIKAIFSYDGAADANPTSNTTSYTISCADETSLVPHVAKDVPVTIGSSNYEDLAVSIARGVSSTGVNEFEWTINGSMIDVDWAVPTLRYVQEGNSSFPSDLNLVKIPNAGEYYFWAITTTSGVSHPIHLHGHDFFLMGSGTGTFSSSSTTLNYVNPTRRDVAMLPGNGWITIAFLADNPGAWLMHCHIAWHVGEGLAVQFLEVEDQIANTMDLSVMDDTCTSWDAYVGTAYYAKSDSGLR